MKQKYSSDSLGNPIDLCSFDFLLQNNDFEGCIDVLKDPPLQDSLDEFPLQNNDQLRTIEIIEKVPEEPHVIQVCTGKCVNNKFKLRKCKKVGDLASHLLIKNGDSIPAKVINANLVHLMSTFKVFNESTHDFHKDLALLIKRETQDLANLNASLNQRRRNRHCCTLKNRMKAECDEKGEGMASVTNINNCKISVNLSEILEDILHMDDDCNKDEKESLCDSSINYLNLQSSNTVNNTITETSSTNLDNSIKYQSQASGVGDLSTKIQISDNDIDNLSLKSNEVCAQENNNVYNKPRDECNYQQIDLESRYPLSNLNSLNDTVKPIPPCNDVASSYVLENMSEYLPLCESQSNNISFESDKIVSESDCVISSNKSRKEDSNISKSDSKLEEDFSYHSSNVSSIQETKGNGKTNEKKEINLPIKEVQCFSSYMRINFIEKRWNAHHIDQMISDPKSMCSESAVTKYKAKKSIQDCKQTIKNKISKVKGSGRKARKHGTQINMNGSIIQTNSKSGKICKSLKVCLERIDCSNLKKYVNKETRKTKISQNAGQNLRLKYGPKCSKINLELNSNENLKSRDNAKEVGLSDVSHKKLYSPKNKILNAINSVQIKNIVNDRCEISERRECPYQPDSHIFTGQKTSQEDGYTSLDDVNYNNYEECEDAMNNSFHSTSDVLSIHAGDLEDLDREVDNIDDVDNCKIGSDLFMNQQEPIDFLGFGNRCELKKDNISEEIISSPSALPNLCEVGEQFDIDISKDHNSWDEVFVFTNPSLDSSVLQPTVNTNEVHSRTCNTPNQNSSPLSIPSTTTGYSSMRTENMFGSSPGNTSFDQRYMDDPFASPAKTIEDSCNQELKEINSTVNVQYFHVPRIAKNFCFTHFLHLNCTRKGCYYSHTMERLLLISLLKELIPSYLEQRKYGKAWNILRHHSQNQAVDRVEFCVSILKPWAKYLAEADNKNPRDFSAPTDFKHISNISMMEVFCESGRGVEAFDILMENFVWSSKAPTTLTVDLTKRFAFFTFLRFCDIHSSAEFSPYKKVSEWGFLASVDGEKRTSVRCELEYYWLQFHIVNDNYDMKNLGNKALCFKFFEMLTLLEPKIPSKADCLRFVDAALDHDCALVVEVMRFIIGKCICEPSSKQLNTLIHRLRKADGDVDWPLLKSLLSLLSYNSISGIVVALEKILSSVTWNPEVQFIIDKCKSKGVDLKCPNLTNFICPIEDELPERRNFSSKCENYTKYKLLPIEFGTSSEETNSQNPNFDSNENFNGSDIEQGVQMNNLSGVSNEESGLMVRENSSRSPLIETQLETESEHCSQDTDISVLIQKVMEATGSFAYEYKKSLIHDVFKLMISSKALPVLACNFKTIADHTFGLEDEEEQSEARAVVGQLGVSLILIGLSVGQVRNAVDIIVYLLDKKLRFYEYQPVHLRNPPSVLHVAVLSMEALFVSNEIKDFNELTSSVQWFGRSSNNKTLLIEDASFRIEVLHKLLQATLDEVEATRSLSFETSKRVLCLVDFLIRTFSYDQNVLGKDVYQYRIDVLAVFRRLSNVYFNLGGQSLIQELEQSVELAGKLRVNVPGDVLQRLSSRVGKCTNGNEASISQQNNYPDFGRLAHRLSLPSPPLLMSTPCRRSLWGIPVPQPLNPSMYYHNSAPPLRIPRPTFDSGGPVKRKISMNYVNFKKSRHF